MPKRPTTSRPGFSAEERAAMKDRARELKAEQARSTDRASGEKAVLDTIADMTGSDRALAQRAHALVAAHAPALSPRLWYGMPAYADSEGKVVCFFQAAAKFKTRYATFAFTDRAGLDDGEPGIWPTGFGLRSLTTASEAPIIERLKKAEQTAK